MFIENVELKLFQKKSTVKEKTQLFLFIKSKHRFL